jgi:hypothetical protein
MAIPIMLISREMRYGACGAMGSANGGSQMRVGNGDDWWCTWMICGSHCRQACSITRDSIMFSM